MNDLIILLTTIGVIFGITLIWNDFKKNNMKKIWISEFKEHPELVKGMHVVTIMVPYGEDYDGLKSDLFNLGFVHTSTQFVGPDLMDTEQNFRKI